MIDTLAKLRVEDFLLDSPDEPVTELEDLLSDSEKIYHARVAKFQLAQYQRMQEFLVKIHDWADQKLQEGGEAACIDLTVARCIGDARKGQHDELRHVLRQMRNERTQREDTIHLYLSHKNHDPS